MPFSADTLHTFEQAVEELKRNLAEYRQSSGATKGIFARKKLEKDRKAAVSNFISVLESLGVSDFKATMITHDIEGGKDMRKLREEFLLAQRHKERTRFLLETPPNLEALVQMGLEIRENSGEEEARKRVYEELKKTGRYSLGELAVLESDIMFEADRRIVERQGMGSHEPDAPTDEELFAIIRENRIDVTKIEGEHQLHDEMRKRFPKLSEGTIKSALRDFYEREIDDKRYRWILNAPEQDDFSWIMDQKNIDPKDPDAAILLAEAAKGRYPAVPHHEIEQAVNAFLTAKEKSTGSEVREKTWPPQDEILEAIVIRKNIDLNSRHAASLLVFNLRHFYPNEASEKIFNEKAFKVVESFLNRKGRKVERTREHLELETIIRMLEREEN